MRDGYLRGALSRPATHRQLDVLAAFVAAGSVSGAARLLDIRPSTVKRHLADLRARSGLTTQQLIYAGSSRWIAGCAELGAQMIRVRDPSRDPRMTIPAPRGAYTGHSAPSKGLGSTNVRLTNVG